jgi:hypothetical protein
MTLTVSKGSSRPRRKKQQPKGRPKGTRRDSDGVEKLVAKIRKLQQQEASTRVESIRCRIEIGEQLQALRSQTDHGQWSKKLKLLGYEKRTAERLMQVAASPLAAEMRTTGTHLGSRLPVDIQKLAQLARLSSDQLRTFLSTHDAEELSREELAALLRSGEDDGELELEDGSVPNSGAPRVTRRVTGSPPTTTKHETTLPDEDEQPEQEAIEAQAAEREEDQKSDTSPKSAPKADAARHLSRVQHYRRIAEGKSRKEDRPVELAIDKHYARFEEEVVRLARKYGRSGCNQAVRAVGFDEQLVSMLLLHRFKATIDPEQAFAPETE